MGTLFIVATPIGNLGDLTQRALDTLRACDRVIAEDTRRTRQLLTHFGVAGKPVDRLDAHATQGQRARLLERLGAGESVALVTDAGTPVVSDPGDAIVRAAIEAGVRVVPIPGASAVLAALVASGLAGEGGFRFVGFLPRGGPARRAAIALVSETPESVVLFESPNRTAETLRDLAEATPERRACVARELTKVHEELVRGTLAELAGARGHRRESGERRESAEVGEVGEVSEGAEIPSWLGEIAIVLGPHDPGDRDAKIDDDTLDLRIDEALARGDHARSIAERLAAWSGRPRRELYARVVARKK